MTAEKLSTRGNAAPLRGRSAPASGALRCRRKFLRFFPQGFRDEKYKEDNCIKIVLTP